MTTKDFPRLWQTIYPLLRDAGPDVFVRWERLEALTGRPAQGDKFLEASGADAAFRPMQYGGLRSALKRAVREMERNDGLTIAGQCFEGFWVRPLLDKSSAC
mgnify:CR=1 FL=1